MIFLSWSLSFLHIILENETKNNFIGAIFAPTTLFINLFANFKLPLEIQKMSPLIPALRSNWLMMHVTVMLLSYTSLICGTLLSISFLILYLIKGWVQKNQLLLVQVSSKNSILNDASFSLKEKLTISSKSFIQDSDFLNNFDNISYRLIGIGFLFLTIGILSGSIWANEAWGSYWTWDPKETWALITWFIFAIYLHVRLIKGWKGFKPAIIASFGFFVVWVCYLGVNILGKGLHSYGWLN